MMWPGVLPAANMFVSLTEAVWEVATPETVDEILLEPSTACQFDLVGLLCERDTESRWLALSTMRRLEVQEAVCTRPQLRVNPHLERALNALVLSEHERSCSHGTGCDSV